MHIGVIILLCICTYCNVPLHKYRLDNKQSHPRPVPRRRTNPLNWVRWLSFNPPRESRGARSPLLTRSKTLPSELFHHWRMQFIWALTVHVSVMWPCIGYHVPCDCHVTLLTCVAMWSCECHVTSDRAYHARSVVTDHVYNAYGIILFSDMY